MVGNSLVVQWLGLCVLTAEGSSIPGRGTKIPQAMWQGQKKKKKNERERNVILLVSHIRKLILHHCTYRSKEFVSFLNKNLCSLFLFN